MKIALFDMKTCFKCGMYKPLDQFYAHPQMGDGYLNKCKECAKSDIARHRVLHTEEYRYRDKRRNSTARRIAQKRSYSAGYRERYPEKYRARIAVNNAVRDGRLHRQPCAECGIKQTQAHHEDYSRPLDVIWLCEYHHKARDAEIKTVLCR